MATLLVPEALEIQSSPAAWQSLPHVAAWRGPALAQAESHPTDPDRETAWLRTRRRQPSLLGPTGDIAVARDKDIRPTESGWPDPSISRIACFSRKASSQTLATCGFCSVGCAHKRPP